MSIHVGSRLRVQLRFVDVTEGGEEEPINLSTASERSLRVVKPDGTELVDPVLVLNDPTVGEGHWDAEEDVLDQVGVWRAQGVVDGYLSAPVSWLVERNP